MKNLFRAVSAVLLVVCATSSAYAQYQVKKNAVPIGRGGGVTGFDAVDPSGSPGFPLTSNGAAAPSFSRLGTAGGGTGRDNSGSSSGDVLAWDGTGFIHTAFTSLFNTACSVAPTICSKILGYTSPYWYGAVCDGVTDDTLNLQAAMNGTPTGGTLYIPPTTTGCLIKRQGATDYSLRQDRPYNIKGGGHYSMLKTDASIPSTVDNLLIVAGSYGDWAGITWDGFGIGDAVTFEPPVLQSFTRHGKRGMAFVDSTFVGFLGISIKNMTIGESGNGYSLFIGPGGNSQFNVIAYNKIWGGIGLDAVADSHRVIYNVLQGSSAYGGYFNFVAGAGKFEFSHNNVTWAGGLRIDSGVQPTVNDNYFEELYATTSLNNAMVDFNGGTGTISQPIFKNNIVGAGVSTTSTPVRFGNASGGIFGGNYIITSTARTGVVSTATLSCVEPNVWTTATPHFSTALANSYAGC